MLFVSDLFKIDGEMILHRCKGYDNWGIVEAKTDVDGHTTLRCRQCGQEFEISDFISYMKEMSKEISEVIE